MKYFIFMFEGALCFSGHAQRGLGSLCRIVSLSAYYYCCVPSVLLSDVSRFCRKYIPEPHRPGHAFPSALPLFRARNLPPSVYVYVSRLFSPLTVVVLAMYTCHTYFVLLFVPAAPSALLEARGPRRETRVRHREQPGRHRQGLKREHKAGGVLARSLAPSVRVAGVFELLFPALAFSCVNHVPPRC